MSKVIGPSIRRLSSAPSVRLGLSNTGASRESALQLLGANPKPARMAWLRAILTSAVEGMYGFAWEFPGIGLHISAGNGARLNAKGNIIVLNVDSAFIANFASATRQAACRDASAASLDELLLAVAHGSGARRVAPWNGPEAEDFARRVLELEPLSAVGGFQVAAGSSAIIVPERVPILHADRQQLESVQCTDLLADLRSKPKDSTAQPLEITMIRVDRFKADAPRTFKAATALTLSGNLRHVDHILAGAANPINGSVRIVHETDVDEHCHASRRNAKPFQVDQFLPALKAYLSGEGDDFLKAEGPAVMPSHGSIVAVMPVTASSGRHLQGQQLRFFLYVSHHKDD